MIADEDHTIVQVNNKLLTDFKKKRDEFIGCQYPRVIHGMDKPIDNCPLVEAALNNQVVESELFDPMFKMWVSTSLYPLNFNQKNSSEFYSGVSVLSFVVRNSGGTKCKKIGVIPRSSAAGIVNFQEFLYLMSLYLFSTHVS